MTKILIVGGGVAALEAALALQELAPELAEVELVAPDSSFTYRPLLVTGDTRTFPLQRLTDDAGGSLRKGTVTRVDAEQHVVHTAEGEELPFDLLLLAPGAIPAAALPGALSFRGPGDAAELEQMVEDALAGEVGSFVFAVPSGARWALPLYELALLARARLVDAGAIGVRVTVVTPEDAPLELFGAQASAAIAELLEDRGIELVPGTTPLAFADGALSVAPGGSVAADRAVALPQLEGPRLCEVSPPTHGASSRPTRSDRSTARSTSGPQETPPASPSNRAESLPSRPTPQPSRSRPAPAQSWSRARSVPYYGACC